MQTKRIILCLLFLAVCGFFYLVWYLYERKNQDEALRERIQSMKASATWSGNLSSVLFMGNTQSKNLLERKIKDILSRQFSLDKPLQLKLYRAGIKMAPEKFLIALFAGWCFFFLIVNWFFVSGFVNALMTSLILFIGFVFFGLNILEKKRGKIILDQLSPAIDIILRGIRAGGTLEKGFFYVIRETPSPLKEEFMDIAKGLEFGLSYETVLHTAANRVNIPEFYFFSTALIIQRQSGGSLVDVLSNIITSINKIKELQLKVKSLSAESKASGYILCGIPSLILLALSFFRPEHIAYFMNDPGGNRLVFIVISLLTMGILFIRQLTKIDI